MSPPPGSASAPVRHAASDPTLVTLDQLIAAIEQAGGLLAEARERAERLRERRSAGEPFASIVPQEPRPLVVELVSESLTSLAAAGSRFRRAEARALREEGMTMDRIAELFGVTRQRISALLRTAAPSGSDDAVQAVVLPGAPSAPTVSGTSRAGGRCRS